MELAYAPNSIRCLRQIFCETLRQEETMETVVPDSQPDPERIVSCCANIVLRSKECRSGSAELSGGIQASVMYLPTGERSPESLQVYLPFTAKLDHPDLDQNSKLCVCPAVRSVEARIVRSRKIQVRVNYLLTVRAYSDSEQTVQSPTDVPEDIQIRTVTYPMLLPVDFSEATVRIGEEWELPASKPLGGAIYCYTAKPVLSERRIAGNKAVFKGALQFHMLYQTTDGEIASFDTQTPFSQYCELGDLCENGDAVFCLALTGCELERVERAEQDSVMLTANLLAQCVVYDTIPVTLCEDAYALRGIWQPEWQENAFQNRLDAQTLNCMMRESAEDSVASVVDVALYSDSPEQERAEGKLRVRVPMTAQVLYYDTDGNLQRRLIHGAPFVETELSPDASCIASASPGSATALLTGDGVSVSCPVEVSLESFSERGYRSISGGTLSDDPQDRREKKPSLIIRKAPAGQSLWELAKEHRTTVEKISRANRLEGDRVPSPATLLIPM